MARKVSKKEVPHTDEDLAAEVKRLHRIIAQELIEGDHSLLQETAIKALMELVTELKEELAKKEPKKKATKASQG